MIIALSVIEETQAKYPKFRTKCRNLFHHQKNGYSDLAVMRAELYERLAQINRIDQAIYDSIYSDIAPEKPTPKNARNPTDRIRAAIESLDSFPSAHQDRQTGKYAGKSYRE